MIVLTYNIRVGIGTDDRQSLARIADVIRASGAQIACLQEVGRRWPTGKFADQPKWLGQRLGMEFVFQPNLTAGPASFGNLVLSRYPVEAPVSYRLTSKAEPRGLLQVKIMADDGPITVFCTHWGLDPAERAIQSTETAAHINIISSPKLLCGDLNDIDKTPPIMGLISAAGLHDLARDAGAAAPTFPSDNPRIRIDYIFGSPNIRIFKAKVIQSPASDHCALSADIEIKPNEK